MVFQALNNPQRYSRNFDCETALLIQVKGAGTIALAKTQGEAQNAVNGGGDGIEYTNVNTNGAAQPQRLWWQGELWYASLGAGNQVNFVIEILSEKGVA